MARILVAEDQPLIAMLLADWIAELGHEMVGPAGNSEAALALIETSPPDAAIVDVSLDGGTGYPVADGLIKRNVPFVFATGQGAGELASRFAGRRVLVKPFDFAAVQMAVEEMIGAHSL